jgi:hypothetical protein
MCSKITPPALLLHKICMISLEKHRTHAIGMQTLYISIELLIASQIKNTLPVILKRNVHYPNKIRSAYFQFSNIIGTLQQIKITLILPYCERLSFPRNFITSTLENFFIPPCASYVHLISIFLFNLENNITRGIRTTYLVIVQRSTFFCHVISLRSNTLFSTVLTTSLKFGSSFKMVNFVLLTFQLKN